MPEEEYERTRVLVTVMTYPHPSSKYRELVCTAGITEALEWVRLYPIDYRYRLREQQFHKYQWIEVGLLPRGAGNDKRTESRKPDLGSIRVLGPPLGTQQGWQERRAVVDRLPVHTLNELRARHEESKVSLGVVRPVRVIDLQIQRDDEEWKPEWRQTLQQLTLFGPPPKPLRKIPFKFTYVFECEDSAKPHRAMVTDWEMGVLWLNERDRLGDDRKAAESVRAKFLGELCRNDKDSRFLMGTTFPYNTWLVLGVFWPPNLVQGALL